MRIYLIINSIASILIYFGLLLLIPLLVAVFYKEWTAVAAFSVASISGVIPGIILKKVLPEFSDIHRTEGMTVVALTWLIAALLGGIPYLFFNLNIVDSLFEAMSGLTTTGATVFKDFSLYPKSLYFWRSFTQWLGGMGILVLFVAILPQFAVAGRELFYAESPGPTEDKLTPRIRHTAINLWALYIGLTLIEIIILTLLGMPFFDSICNSFSTLAAGGFSPNPESIMGYNNSLIEWVIVGFMFLAGANFALQFRVIRSGNPKLLIKNSEFLLYTLIFITSTLLVAFILCIENNYSIVDSLRLGAFQCISILTTTGFATCDFAQWSNSATIILIMLMFVGGCAGSAGGGIKVVRILLIIKSAFNEILQSLHPRAVLALKLDKQFVSKDIMKQIFIFFIFYMLILGASTLVVSIIENSTIIGFTSTAATLGNIGPGLGALGPMGNYADLNVISKIILIINMWIGRLEIMTVLIVLYPGTWQYLSKQ